MKQRTIFMAFFRVGILGFGGGPSAIPIVKKEVVDRYGWMDADEFADVLALANALPHSNHTGRIHPFPAYGSKCSGHR